MVLCGYWAATRMRLFAILPIRSSASERLMEYRFPTSSRFCRTVTGVFGWEGIRGACPLACRRFEKYDVGQEVFSLARGPDGSLWVGISGEGPGEGLQQLKDGAVKPFVTPTFNGSSFDIGTLMFDHDGNLWVGTKARGLLRIHGNAAGIRPYEWTVRRFRVRSF